MVSSRQYFQYYRARYYDASLGRFLSEDPTGFSAGIDFYVYGSNSPVEYSDPTGFTNYEGFSGGDLAQLQAAVERVKERLKKCDNCAGSETPKILHNLETATFVYDTQMKDCGGAANGVHDWIHHIVRLGPYTFNGRCYCVKGPAENSLASTVLHETFHLGHVIPHENHAYALEKKCFGCQDPRKN